MAGTAEIAVRANRATMRTRTANPGTQTSKARPTIAIRIGLEITRQDLQEDRMTEDRNRFSGKLASGSDKSTEPVKGGDHIRKAQEWGGGSKGSKGGITRADRQNENSSAKS
jgi:hypothetical protein